MNAQDELDLTLGRNFRRLVDAGVNPLVSSPFKSDDPENVANQDHYGVDTDEEHRGKTLDIAVEDALKALDGEKETKA